MRNNPPRPPMKPRPTPEARWLTDNRLKHAKRQGDIGKLFDMQGCRVCEWETGTHPIPDDAMRVLRAYFQRLETMPDEAKKKRRRRLM